MPPTLSYNACLSHCTLSPSNGFENLTLMMSHNSHYTARLVGLVQWKDIFKPPQVVSGTFPQAGIIGLATISSHLKVRFQVAERAISTAGGSSWCYPLLEQEAVVVSWHFVLSNLRHLYSVASTRRGVLEQRSVHPYHTGQSGSVVHLPYSFFSPTTPPSRLLLSQTATQYSIAAPSVRAQ
jgi:hypothetical protein